MSALAQKQTFALQQVAMVMSALPPKADVCGANRHVCFGPEADIGWIYSITSSAALPELQRHIEAERLGGLEVNQARNWSVRP